MQRHPNRKRPDTGNATVTAAVGMGETVGRLRARRNSLFTQTVIWVTGLICMAFLLGSLAQAWSNSQLEQQVQAAQQQVQQTQQHHDALARMADHYKNPTVIESEARQQLGFVRPGEHAVVVVSENGTAQQKASRQRSTSTQRGFWQEWWQVFFGE